MALLFRTLIWLLVLALPAQGIAAVTMSFCGPDQPGGAATGSMLRPASSAHSHDGAAAQVAHGHVLAAVGGSMAGDASAPAPAGQAESHTCSACASCCSIGAMLGSAPSVPIADFAATVFATLAVSVDTFVVGGPDRPPRPVLA